MATSMVDWAVALNTATKLVKPGPEITRSGAAAVVAELREAAVRAEAYVTEVTGLVTPPAASPVLVVDRPRWIEANLDGFRQILAPLNAKATEKLRSSGSTMASIGPRITGVEVGALLSYLAPKVLGQFDPFFPGPAAVAGGGTGKSYPPAVGVASSWSHPTSWPSSGSCSSSPATSGSGSACTRRPTGCSSRPCRGCGST